MDPISHTHFKHIFCVLGNNSLSISHNLGQLLTPSPSRMPPYDLVSQNWYPASHYFAWRHLPSIHWKNKNYYMILLNCSMLCKSFPLSSCIPIEAVNFKRENILCQCDFDMKLFQRDCIHCEFNQIDRHFYCIFWPVFGYCTFQKLVKYSFSDASSTPLA